MIFHLRKWMNRLRFAIVFVAFTFVMYHILVLVSNWIEPTQKYREPLGRAVKVFQPNDHISFQQGTSMGERLKLFYWIGE